LKPTAPSSTSRSNSKVSFFASPSPEKRRGDFFCLERIVGQDSSAEINTKATYLVHSCRNQIERAAIGIAARIGDQHVKQERSGGSAGPGRQARRTTRHAATGAASRHLKRSRDCPRSTRPGSAAQQAASAASQPAEQGQRSTRSKILIVALPLGVVFADGAKSLKPVDKAKCKAKAPSQTRQRRHRDIDRALGVRDDA
jgi:hypothetical protein